MAKPISREHYREAQDIYGRLHRLYMEVPGSTIGFDTLETAVRELAKFIEDDTKVAKEAA